MVGLGSESEINSTSSKTWSEPASSSTCGSVFGGLHGTGRLEGSGIDSLVKLFHAFFIAFPLDGEIIPLAS